MRKVLGTAAIAFTLVAGGATVAVASQDGPTCHVKSSSTTTETRDVTGQRAQSDRVGPIRKVVKIVNGQRRVTYVRTVTRFTYSGTQTREVTVTLTRCGGEVTPSTTATLWTGAKIIATSTVQRVR